MKKAFIVFISIALLTFVFLFAIEHIFTENVETENTENKENLEEVQNDTEPPQIIIQKEDQHLSMSVIGDIMCHDSQYKDAYVSSTKSYDFSYVFTAV